MFPAHMSHPAFPPPACPPRSRTAVCYGVQLDCNLGDPKEDLPAGRTGCRSPRGKEVCFSSGAQVLKYRKYWKRSRGPWAIPLQTLPHGGSAGCYSLNKTLQGQGALSRWARDNFCLLTSLFMLRCLKPMGHFPGTARHCKGFYCTLRP